MSASWRFKIDNKEDLGEYNRATLMLMTTVYWCFLMVTVLRCEEIMVKVKVSVKISS